MTVIASRGAGPFIAPAVVLSLLVALVPLVFIFYNSTAGGTSTEAFSSILGSSLFLRATKTTIEVSLVASLLSVVLGYLVALHLARQSARRRAALMVLVLLPFWTSILVKSYAFTIILGREGIINSFLSWATGMEVVLPLIFNRVGVMVGMTNYLTPLVVFPVLATMMPDLIIPYDQNVAWFLLVDIVSDENSDIAERLQEVLGDAMESGQISDVLVSVNEAQRAAIWKLRHSVTESHKKYGMGMSHDVAVPIGDIPHFIQIAKAKVDETFPQAEIAIVGHVGDGNLHYNVMFEKSRWDAIPDQPQMRKDVYKAIYDLAAQMNGTFSAEHGIGALHVAEMKTYKSEIELEMMKGIKALFDPHNLMNPGRVLPD